MNMKKWKRRTIALLLALLVGVTGLKQAAYAEESTPTYYDATDYSSFKNAVGHAQDGDIITIWGVVTVGDTLTVGRDDVHLTIKRSDENSYLNFSSGETVFTNVTIDGGGVISKYSFLKLDVGNMSFTDCTFQNCGNPTYQGGTGCSGGAVRVDRGTVTFTDCLFTANSGISGGHIAIYNESAVTMNNCTLTQGIAGVGGAIYVGSSTGVCNIESSVITGNNALDFGGGIANRGKVTLKGTKLYSNTATNGGADIGNTTTGTVELKDTIEQLAELFEPEKILPVAWVCDYDFEENIYIPDVDPNQENALLKLQYEIIPDDSGDETESTEPGTEEGTESTDQVETSEPSTEPTDPSEPEETDPDDTEDTEEPTTPTEPGTDAPDDSEQGTTPDDSEPSEPSQSVGDTNTDNSTQTDNSNNSVNTDNSDNSTHTDNSDNSSVDNSSVDNSVTNNDSSSSSTTSNNTVDNSSVDNSKVDNSNVSNNSDSSTTTTNTTTTTNNYYTTESNQSPGQTTAQPIVIQVQNDSAAPDADSEKVTESGSSSPNIRIDAQGVDCVFEYVDGVYNISITAQKEADESDAVVPAVAPVQAVEDSGGQEVDWLEVIQIVLLVAIFICLIWQPRRTGNGNIQG